MTNMRNTHNILVRKPERERNYLQTWGVGVDGWITLKWILKKEG
jgi:hypothetical protein